MTVGKPDDVEWRFGPEAHLGMMFTENEVQQVPPLVLTVSMDRPGIAPGLNAAAALSALVDQGLPVGTLTVDLGYSQLRPEHYALPARALGYTLMHMFKHKELGKVQATAKGLQVIEGGIYGPCMPEQLRNAVKDHVEGRIDEETMLARVEARKDFQARIKTADDGAASYTYRCPGAGEGRTVRCEWKPVTLDQEQREAANPRKLLPLITDLPDETHGRPQCCANLATVSVPATKFARFVTLRPYKTPEWQSYYNSSRSQMEGKNGFVKNPLGSRIAIAGERRFRGWAKQLLALLVKIVAANVEAILSWIDAEEDGKHDEPAAVRGRPRNPRLQEHLPPKNGPPIRIIGEPASDPNGTAA